MLDLCPDVPNTTDSGRLHRLLGPERRCGISDMQFGAAMLSHAVAYLIVDQLAGGRAPVQANRQAIRILCQAGEAMAHKERREPERQRIAAWLRKVLRNPVAVPT